MKLLDIAALICRGAGLVLLVQGLSGAAAFLFLDPILASSIPDSSVPAIDGVRASFPSLGEAVCGLAFLWFARPLGSLLARGISSGEP